MREGDRRRAAWRRHCCCSVRAQVWLGLWSHFRRQWAALVRGGGLLVVPIHLRCPGGARSSLAGVWVAALHFDGWRCVLGQAPRCRGGGRAEPAARGTCPARVSWCHLPLASLYLSAATTVLAAKQARCHDHLHASSWKPEPSARSSDSTDRQGLSVPGSKLVRPQPPRNFPTPSRSPPATAQPPRAAAPSAHTQPGFAQPRSKPQAPAGKSMTTR